MIYESYCSGIEAASVAWEPLGWTPNFFAEVDKFPSAVLAHRFPNVPNLGDMTKIHENEHARTHHSDLVVAGTPCQGFSIAGLRKGLDDDRSNLCLSFVRLVLERKPRWLLWENVPGVFTTGKGSDFGSFLSGLSGVDVPVPKQGWKNSGVIIGAGGYYSLAWRCVDAQFTGVPQRRRRVFVVGHFGDWRRAAAVLFECHSLSGHPPPSREKGESAPTIPSRRTGGGGLGTDFDCDGGLVASTGDTSHCLNAGGMGRQDYETETLITAPCLRTNMRNNSDPGMETSMLVAIQNTTRGKDQNGLGISYDDTMYTIDQRSQHAIAFSAKDHGADAGETAPTLRAGGHNKSHANSGNWPAVAFTQNQNGDLLTGDVLHSLSTNGNASGRNSPKVATFDPRNVTSKTNRMRVDVGAPAGTLHEQGLGVISPMAVRRLTPRECERLQGFPDDWTLVPYRGKTAADGPRYKALGNSFAVPVVRWIGQRIQVVEDLVRKMDKGE